MKTFEEQLSDILSKVFNNTYATMAQVGNDILAAHQAEMDRVGEAVRSACPLCARYKAIKEGK